MFVNYRRTTELPNLVNAGVNEQGLYVSGQWTATGAPTNTPEVYLQGAILQNTFDSTVYYNSGTTAVPNFQLLTGGGGGGITTADNGLNLSTATNVQLGGALIVDTQIDAATFDFGVTNASTFFVSSDAGDVISFGSDLVGATMTFPRNVNITASGITTPNLTLGATGQILLSGNQGVQIFSVTEKQKGAIPSASQLDIMYVDNPAYTYLEVTGTTTINTIESDVLDRAFGTKVTLFFTDALTVTHNAAPTANGSPILLNGGLDFSTSAGDNLTLVFCRVDGVDAWREISRVVL